MTVEDEAARRVLAEVDAGPDALKAQLEEEAALAARTATDVANNTASELHVTLDGLSAAYVGIGPPEIADTTLGTRVPVATSGWGTLIC